MEKESLYHQRLARILAAVALEKLDRTPVVLQYSGFAAHVTKTPMAEFLSSPARNLETMIQAYHLPGHTPDSVAWKINDSLFVGDVIRCDGGIGWMDVHWGSCVSDYRSSLQRLLRLGVRQVYPGHGACGSVTRDTVEEALRRLNTLTQADGNLLVSVGRPSPRRNPEEPAKTIRLPTGLTPGSPAP